MPCASSRSSSRAPASSASAPTRSSAASAGARCSCARASRRRSARPTSRCCAPSCRLRSIRRRAASLADAGAADVDVVAEDGVQPLRGPDDFWSVVLGSGYRGTVDQLDDAQRERVRAATLAALAGVTAIRTPALYGTATRPAAC
jgi:hypothetical protein